MLSITALTGLPEIRPGDELAPILAGGLSRTGITLTEGDVVVVAHKIVSKSEGRIRRLSEIEAGSRALELSSATGPAADKDARQVQAVLDETAEVLRFRPGVLICVTRHGFVCANAGVDASNAADEDELILLPEDPDGSARRLRGELRKLSGVAPAVLITDSFGRAWRHGQTDVAIGCAGLSALEDWRGRRDAHGRELHATQVAAADELAAAADLARTKDGSQPAIHIRGAERHVLPADDDGPGVRVLIRPEAEDLFR